MERILESIAIAKSRGATLRVGPELEIPYVDSSITILSCDYSNLVDMGASTIFLKVVISNISTYLLIELPGDTVLHSWEVLAKLLASEETQGIVCDLGMCVY